MEITRGIRNNNPFNIVLNSTHWLGSLPRDKSTDVRFVQFELMDYGLRAGIVLLRTYFKKYHLNTIRGIISRFAPSSENDTESYISYVCQYCSICDDDCINYKDDDFFRLVQAICYYESHYLVSRDRLERVIKFFRL